jgi:hypothetical protein
MKRAAKYVLLLKLFHLRISKNRSCLTKVCQVF